MLKYMHDQRRNDKTQNVNSCYRINIIKGAWSGNEVQVEKTRKEKKKSTPIDMFGRPQVDHGVPFLLPMVLGSRQVGVLWGFKRLRAAAALVFNFILSSFLLSSMMEWCVCTA